MAGWLAKWLNGWSGAREERLVGDSTTRRLVLVDYIVRAAGYLNEIIAGAHARARHCASWAPPAATHWRMTPMGGGRRRLPVSAMVAPVRTRLMALCAAIDLIGHLSRPLVDCTRSTSADRQRCESPSRCCAIGVRAIDIVRECSWHNKTTPAPVGHHDHDHDDDRHRRRHRRRRRLQIKQPNQTAVQSTRTL
jgi:hypothetical protein